MSSFKEIIAEDNFMTFLNVEEFGERRIIIYNGVTYDGAGHDGIPVVLRGLKEQDRRQLQADHAQGLFLVSAVLHCARDDLGGKQPEKGQRIRINDEEGSDFFNEFYVAASKCEFGMLRIELEAIAE